MLALEWLVKDTTSGPSFVDGVSTRKTWNLLFP